MRPVEFGTNTREIAIGRHAATKSDMKLRRDAKKVYPCAKCNTPLTMFEHVKFLFMCKRCTDNGAEHYTREVNGKVWVTN